jgi:adenylate kinase
MIVILLGPPGSGKGTHSQIIRTKYELSPISTGDILRERMKNDDEIGRKITEMMGTGKLFPDEKINELTERAILEECNNMNYKGLLFDGYPRTLNQAHFLEKTLQKIGKKVDCVLVFQISDNIIIERLSARRVDRKTGNVYNLLFSPPPKDSQLDLYQRIDDKEDVIKHRLEIYRRETEPLIEFYSQKGKTKEIDASQNLETTNKNINEILNNFVK